MFKEYFNDCTIAQDDDEDYQESGYIALIIKNVAYLSRYSHNSCYDTYESLMYNDGITHVWKGTIDELVQLSKNKADYAMPDRAASPDDYDYDHLMSTYEQVVKWDEIGRPLNTFRLSIHEMIDDICKKLGIEVSYYDNSISYYICDDHLLMRTSTYKDHIINFENVNEEYLTSYFQHFQKGASL